MATNQDNNQSVKMEIMGKKYPVVELPKYDIVGGPSLLDLIVSYAYACEGRRSQQVTFTLEGNSFSGLSTRRSVMVKARVLSLCHNVGAGRKAHFVEGQAWSGNGSSGIHTFKAFYDVDARTGYLYASERFSL